MQGVIDALDQMHMIAPLQGTLLSAEKLRSPIKIVGGTAKELNYSLSRDMLDRDLLTPERTLDARRTFERGEFSGSLAKSGTRGTESRRFDRSAFIGADGTAKADMNASRGVLRFSSKSPPNRTLGGTRDDMRRSTMQPHDRTRSTLSM